MDKHTPRVIYGSRLTIQSGKYRGAQVDTTATHREWVDEIGSILAEHAALREQVKLLAGALEGMIANVCAACDNDYVIRTNKKEWESHVAATTAARAALEKVKP